MYISLVNTNAKAQSMKVSTLIPITLIFITGCSSFKSSSTVITPSETKVNTNNQTIIEIEVTPKGSASGGEKR